jgi:hypothetical protein
MGNGEKFDKFWQLNAERLPKLVSVLREVNSSPSSNVASESSF